MLQLRPNCEYCDKDLPPGAADAMICSYECTFCADCVERHLANVCPNCGGGFASRPIRPQNAHREGISRVHQPPAAARAALKWDKGEITVFVAGLKDTPPEQR